MTAQFVTLAVIAWAKLPPVPLAANRCRRHRAKKKKKSQQSSKFSGYLKMSLPKNKTLHRTFSLQKLCDNAAVGLEGGADRDHAWEESAASLGGEKCQRKQRCVGNKAPRQQITLSAGEGLTLGCLSISPSLAVKELSVPPRQLLATRFS